MNDLKRRADLCTRSDSLSCVRLRGVIRLRGVKLGFWFFAEAAGGVWSSVRGQLIGLTNRYSVRLAARSSGWTYGGIVRTAPARRAGSASIASSSATADSASFKTETAILADANGPEVPIW